MSLDSSKNKKICIIYGGWSEEREISLMSGKAVYDVLKNSDYEVFILDLKNNKQMLSEFVNNNSIDIIFNLIHGKGGEDGLVQSWIEDLKIDYDGSNSVSSSASFSKRILPSPTKSLSKTECLSAVLILCNVATST